MTEMSTFMTGFAICATVCFSQYGFTGKERDQESGLDYFGARYNSSSMGRFMSPDPGNIGASPKNPQTWNMYSYGLNNPLRITDPTGLYVCEDSTDCNSTNDKNFAAALSAARDAANNLTGDDKTAALAAVNAYGAMGVDNGVNVRFDANISEGGGVTEVSGVAGNTSADNPNGQNINVTFKPDAVGGDVSAAAGLVGHEGSHVGDASAWVSSGFAASADPTRGQTEFNAYHVQFNIQDKSFALTTPPGGSYSSWINLPNGRVPWDQGATFKGITPDLQQKIQQNYKNLDAPAFQPGGKL
jgi:RHS repeat-associated protein